MLAALLLVALLLEGWPLSKYSEELPVPAAVLLLELELVLFPPTPDPTDAEDAVLVDAALLG